MKIILKKNVKGNEKMVYDELEMLQRMHHPHIVKFVDWFESKVRVGNLEADGLADKRPRINTTLSLNWQREESCLTVSVSREGSRRKMRRRLSDRSLKLWIICTRTMLFTEVRYACFLRQSMLTISDLKPENLLYLTSDPHSDLVLADFGIAKMLDSKDEVLTTMAGSFGYAAPEVMLKKGHGKPVDMWSLGVITYTLLCGYSPFRSENLQDLIDECSNARVIFHERYWKDVSGDAKDFIGHLLQPMPDDRWTSKVCLSCLFLCLAVHILIHPKQALQHSWLSGDSATDHNLLPEIRAYMAKARLRRGIEIVKLANRIEALKMQEDENDSAPGESDVPSDAKAAAGSALGSGAGIGIASTTNSKGERVSGSGAGQGRGGIGAMFGGAGGNNGGTGMGSKTGLDTSKDAGTAPGGKKSLSRMAKGAIFREVVLAKVREEKEREAALRVERDAQEKEKKRRSFQG